jgi:hypothetical protein
VRAVAALLLVFAGACSALDNFGAFTFEAADMTVVPDGGGLPFGSPCTANTCMEYMPMRPVSCVTVMGAQTFQDGMCTRTCTVTAGCAEFPDATCSAAGLQNYCLPKCVGGGNTCRNGYNCCVGATKVANGVAGACTPQSACN